MIRWRYSKRDGNHKEIVEGLRAAGFQVVELHSVGGGVPDILVISPARLRLMEIKNPKGFNRREKSQERFRQTYRGPKGSLVEVRSLEEALLVMGIRLGPRVGPA